MNYQQEMKWRRFKNQPLVVWLILGIQVVVFLGMTFVGFRFGLGLEGSKNSGILMLFGAMQNNFIIETGQYWRLITPIFVHVGLMHLVVNSVFLYFAGTQLEALLGHFRFLVVYLLSGLAGNLLSFAFGAPDVPSAGASSAVFGLFGLFVALGRVYRNHPSIQMMSQQMLTLILVNLFFNIFSLTTNIWAHLGGAIGGFLLGLIVTAPILKNTRFEGDKDIHRQIRAGILFVFMLVFCLVYGLRGV